MYVYLCLLGGLLQSSLEQLKTLHAKLCAETLDQPLRKKKVCITVYNLYVLCTVYYTGLFYILLSGLYLLLGICCYYSRDRDCS